MNLLNYGLTISQSFPVSWKHNDHESSERTDTPAKAKVAELALSEVHGSPAGFPAGFHNVAETAVLYTTMFIHSSSGNRPVGSVNGTSWMVENSRSKPLLSLDREEWGSTTEDAGLLEELRVPYFPRSAGDRWVDIVVNNLDDTGHPFHMVSHAQVQMYARSITNVASTVIIFTLSLPESSHT